jgi:hypothetical protein
MGLQGSIHQSVTPGWRTADCPLELALREHFLTQALFNQMFGQRLHAYIILDPSSYCKFPELNRRPPHAAGARRVPSTTAQALTAILVREAGQEDPGPERADVPGT